MAILVDTTVFITLERHGRRWQNSLSADIDGEPPAIASITASELLAGVYRAETDQRRGTREAHVNEILQTLPVLAFDLETARIHARLWAQLVLAGQTIGRYDLLIAATALARGYTLLTDNVREFSRVPGLDVRQPSW
jgi:tRNA(fMet)-specific endonuclease VapC